MNDRAGLIAVARGDASPDLVVEGAQVFCAFTKDWLDTDVAVAGGRVAGLGRFEGGERIDGAGRYLVPGFIDAHVHIESSKLMMDEFARAVLPHGTTAVVCDPHEIANVLGRDGIHWMLDVCSKLPLEVFVMTPSCVPASAFESPSATLGPDDMESVLRRSHAIGIAEMMDFPGVIAGAQSALAKLELSGGTHVDGHAPGVRGRALDAYIAAGIRSDHEATTYDEALEKRRKGMWILIREASNAHNLVELLPLVKDFGPDYCAFCTDDREPTDLVRLGHLDQMCRVAVAHGVSPEDALLLASLHPARCHGLRNMGAIAPGYKADLLLLSDVTNFGVDKVFKNGRLVASNGVAVAFRRAEVPPEVRNTVRPAPVAEADFAIASSGADVRVIEIIPEQLLTRVRIETPLKERGMAIADPSRDLAKIAVVERHKATGRVGMGFVTGFGLRRGAFASTVAHDAHNMVIVGVNDSDMAICARRLIAIEGGLVAAEGGTASAELPLPIAGLLSDQPLESVVHDLERLEACLADLGVVVASPFMTLSFLALSVIPTLKITDRGLIDIDTFELVPLEVER
ncbi:MAG: adenine deaminase [Actinobacteria bacterium]|nr:adenine deaminase [Actinomycetota bacterium]